MGEPVDTVRKLGTAWNVIKANVHGRAAGDNVVLSYQAGKKPYPISVSIRLTMKCNLTCTYCQVWKTEEHDRMPTEDFTSIIDQMAGMGTKMIGFSGGEPMLHPEVGKIISHAKEQGIVTAMATNGWFMKQKIDEIQDLDVVGISIDGREELHDLHRGKGSFKRALEALELATSRNMKAIIYATISKDNLHDVDFIFSLARKMKVKCSFHPIMSTSRARDGTDKLALSPDEYSGLFRKILYKSKRGANMMLPDQLYSYMMETEGSGQYHNNLKCFAGALFCVMNPNGDLFHCAEFVDKFEPPNAQKLGFEEAFNRLPTIYCTGCSYPCYVQKNLMYSFNPQILMHAWRNV